MHVLRQTFSMHGNVFELLLHYVPYARQDKNHAQGDPLSIAAFADIINMLQFDKVYISDPHSDVTPAVLNRSVVVNTQLRLFSKAMYALKSDVQGLRGRYDVIVAPDMGAYKKAEEIATAYGVDLAVFAKKRNKETGEIIGLELISNTNLQGKKVVVIDDICDGGFTFTELGKSAPPIS